MHAEADAVSDSAAQRLHAFDLVRPYGVFSMDVAPVIQMVGEEISTDIQLMQACQLVFSCQLHMLHSMAVNAGRVFFPQAFYYAQYLLGRAVAVSMDRNRIAVFLTFLQDIEHGIVVIDQLAVFGAAVIFLIQ